MELGLINPLDHTDWSFALDPNYEVIKIDYGNEFPTNEYFMHIDNNGYTFVRKGAVYFYQIGSVMTMGYDQSRFMGEKIARYDLRTRCLLDIDGKIKRLNQILRTQGCNKIYHIIKEKPKVHNADPFGAIGCNGITQLAIFGKREPSVQVYGFCKF
jgi:hypothetical protein